MERRWYVAQIKPNGLQLATRNLERQGLEVFCPLQRVDRRSRGRTRSVTVPFFPGYFFVALAPAGGEMRAASHTRGVARLVTVGASGPEPVPDVLIAALKGRCSPEGVVQPPEPKNFEVGEQVRVTDGPLVGQVSRIVALAPEERIWMLLDLMGRETRVAVKRGDVERF
ncbi:MAG: transcription termination/antitermination protein NusG [Limimaricola soesokkakensis]|uniref:transcription termination/antitermination protein NusG n=1 Tax=Limimaricola soesokkakensis TaxID=1343159 RepID=UPI004058F2F9